MGKTGNFFLVTGRCYSESSEFFAFELHAANQAFSRSPCGERPGPMMVKDWLAEVGCDTVRLALGHWQGRSVP
jgi:hypothetical protein